MHCDCASASHAANFDQSRTCPNRALRLREPQSAVAGLPEAGIDQSRGRLDN
jgi:hypothetical protein